MTCLSIPHYIMGENSSDEAPSSFKISGMILKESKQTFLGWVYAFPKVKHYASANTISVTDPYLDEKNCNLLRSMTLPSITEAKEFATRVNNGELASKEIAKEYENQILKAYPGMDVLEKEYNGVIVPIMNAWAIDITFLDYNAEKLIFINQSDAIAAFELIRSVM